MGIPSRDKQPSESRLLWVECAGRLAVGETVTGVISTTVDPATVPPLVISGAIGSGTQIQFRANDEPNGTGGIRYKVTFLYSTSLGNIREAEILIQIKDE